MKLILTRHGETQENKEGVLQGWLPGRLTTLGKEQARLLGERLRNVHIDYVYTSDVARCVETAMEIAKHHPTVIMVQEPLVRERGLGVFEGRKIGKSDWEALPGDLLTNKPSGGESFVEVFERVTQFYHQSLKKHVDHTVLVVAHGGSICLLQGVITGLSLPESMKLEALKNAACSEFIIAQDGTSTAVRLNSTYDTG